MTNFLLGVIALILACLTWGTGNVLGTLLGLFVLWLIGSAFIVAVKHIWWCLKAKGS